MSQFVITLLPASGIALGLIGLLVGIQMLRHRGPQHPLLRKPPHD